MVGRNSDSCNSRQIPVLRRVQSLVNPNQELGTTAGYLFPRLKVGQSKGRRAFQVPLTARHLPHFSTDVPTIPPLRTEDRLLPRNREVKHKMHRHVRGTPYSISGTSAPPAGALGAGLPGAKKPIEQALQPRDEAVAAHGRPLRS